jgi:hypothetical protein
MERRLQASPSVDARVFSYGRRTVECDLGSSGEQRETSTPLGSAIPQARMGLQMAAPPSRWNGGALGGSMDRRSTIGGRAGSPSDFLQASFINVQYGANVARLSSAGAADRIWIVILSPQRECRDLIINRSRI